MPGFDGPGHFYISSNSDSWDDNSTEQTSSGDWGQLLPYSSDSTSVASSSEKSITSVIERNKVISSAAEKRPGPIKSNLASHAAIDRGVALRKHGRVHGCISYH